MVGTLTTIDILGRLKTLRKEMALRQESLAERLGVDRSTYIRKERGAIPITTDEWLKLAKALERDPSYFFLCSPKPGSAEAGLAGRERLLLKLYRSLRVNEQDDMISAVYLKLRSIRRKAVQDTLRMLREA